MSFLIYNVTRSGKIVIGTGVRYFFYQKCFLHLFKLRGTENRRQLEHNHVSNNNLLLKIVQQIVGRLP